MISGPAVECELTLPTGIDAALCVHQRQASAQLRDISSRARRERGHAERRILCIREVDFQIPSLNTGRVPTERWRVYTITHRKQPAATFRGIPIADACRHARVRAGNGRTGFTPPPDGVDLGAVRAAEWTGVRS